VHEHYRRHGVVQHVTSPTHRAWHTLHVILTRTDINVQVLPPALSEHSFISVDLELQSGRHHRPLAVRRRQWRSFYFDSFCNSLRHSDLLTDPPDDCASLVECYNTTLQSLLDQHAPFVAVKPRTHTNAPWYDRQCWTIKAATRRLECAYRRDKSESNRAAWKHQSQLLRATLRQRYVAYWSKTIANNSHDSKALWSKLDVLLKTTQQSSPTARSTATFADFFRSKVKKIHVETANAPKPIAVDRSCEGLSAFDDVTADEIRRLVVKALTKHCSLDPAPTWLIKRTLPLLSDILAKICNTSFREGVFPEKLKQAVVRPRLKKITLDKDDLNSYNSVSSSARSMYAISVLRSHGMEASALQQVFRTVVVSKLTYAAPAWWGFTTSVDRQHIDAVLRRAARSDLWTLAGTPDALTFENLCNSADDELFTKIRTFSNHILHALSTELQSKTACTLASVT